MSELAARPAEPAVGRPLPHESAPRHVTGTAIYTDDLAAGRADVLTAWPVQSEHAHALHAALGADNGNLLLAGELTGLRKVGLVRELVPLAEQRLDVLLREVNVMRGNLDEKGILLVGFDHTRDVGSAQRAQCFARHHAFLVGGYDEYRHLRMVG